MGFFFGEEEEPKHLLHSLLMLSGFTLVACLPYLTGLVGLLGAAGGWWQLDGHLTQLTQLTLDLQDSAYLASDQSKNLSLVLETLHSEGTENHHALLNEVRSSTRSLSQLLATLRKDPVYQEDVPLNGTVEGFY